MLCYSLPVPTSAAHMAYTISRLLQPLHTTVLCSGDSLSYVTVTGVRLS
jgi:hypothetical protein